jgi:hypothetical protein
LDTVSLPEDRSCPRCKRSCAPSWLWYVLSRTYLHAMTVKVSATGDGKAGSHVTMNTHTAYYPLSLLSASTGRVCRPWQCAEDARDALEIAMEQVPLVFAGPDGQFDSMKHAALSAAQMRLRPKVVYTLMSLRDLAARAAAIAVTLRRAAGCLLLPLPPLLAAAAADSVHRPYYRYSWTRTAVPEQPYSFISEIVNLTGAFSSKKLLVGHFRHFSVHLAHTQALVTQFLQSKIDRRNTNLWFGAPC